MTDSDLVKVAYAQDQSEAELIQGLLRTADVESVVRRAPGFDVPDFLAAGPREVLVAASDLAVAQAVLGDGAQSDPDPPPPTAPNHRTRAIAGVLFAVLLVGVIVCVAADVFP